MITYAFFFFLVIVPINILLILIWLLTRNAILGKSILYFWIFIFGIAFFEDEIRTIYRIKKLQRDDFIGEFVIDRKYFAGKQANWQYDNFRFEIKENDSIYFYVTNKEYVIKTYKGKVEYTNPYGSNRLKIIMNQPTHHILNSNPTIFRSRWSYFMVFNSPKFGNMFFEKGSWCECN